MKYDLIVVIISTLFMLLGRPYYHLKESALSNGQITILVISVISSIIATLFIIILLSRYIWWVRKFYNFELYCFRRGLKLDRREFLNNTFKGMVFDALCFISAIISILLFAFFASLYFNLWNVFLNLIGI